MKLLNKLIKNKKILYIGIGVLLLLLILVLFLTTKKDKNEEKPKPKTTETKQTETAKLTVFDENSNERPFAVMIDNAPAARPHSGLDKAYIIYEITVEGGITRMMALFKDANVEKIGPVRSSRHYFLDYALENDAIYVHFGWSPQAQSDIKTMGVNNLNGLTNPASMFYRSKDRKSPHNAYTTSENVKKAIEKMGYRSTSDDYKVLNYNVNPVDLSTNSTSVDANNVKVNYNGSYYTNYTYDAENKYYLRYINGKAHTDLESGSQYHFKNIIVTNIGISSIAGDEKGRQDLSDIGSGIGYYISEGKAIQITWEKKSRSGKTTYKTTDGNELQVNDGNTFIQIIPNGKTVDFS